MVQQYRKEQNVARLFFLFFFPPASRNKIALPESQVNLLRYAVTVISL